MSGLAAVLAGRHRGGVYRWEAAFDVDEVRSSVEHAEVGFGLIEGWQAETRSGFHDQVAAALDFPDYYGRNLDALHDCLGDLASPVVVLWESWGLLARAEPRFFATVVDLLDQRADVLTVLLRGPVPDPPPSPEPPLLD